MPSPSHHDLATLIRRAQALIAAARVVAHDAALDPNLPQAALTPYLSILLDDPTLLADLTTTLQALTLPPKPHGVSLTPREKDVLDLLPYGYSNTQIAVQLSITTHTAKFHVQSILDKLGAQSRTEAVALAAKANLITL